MNTQQPQCVRVRPATAHDAPAIWIVHVRSIREVCAGDYTPEQIEAWAGPKQPEDYIRALAGGEQLWVAEIGSAVAGFACLRGNKLRGLYVGPTSQRRGVGSALLNAVEAAATQQGISTLTLNSTFTARTFYEARNFRADEPIVRRMGGTDVPCIPMSKNLGTGRES
jgi:putative acetyltransferase